jgi:hypothetical protein
MNLSASETGAGITVACKVHFKPGAQGRRRLRQGEAPVPPAVEPGRVPRLARLMALAIHFDGLIRKGAVRDYADLARLGHVTRARVTQIMNLLNLAPDTQEEILFLPRTASGRDPISERQIRPVAAMSDWRRQRHLWQKLRGQLVVSP